jgi:hypothetical protein
MHVAHALRAICCQHSTNLLVSLTTHRGNVPRVLGVRAHAVVTSWHRAAGQSSSSSSSRGRQQQLVHAQAQSGQTPGSSSGSNSSSSSRGGSAASSGNDPASVVRGAATVLAPT